MRRTFCPRPVLAAGGGAVATAVYQACGGRGDRIAASAAVCRLLADTDADDMLWRYPVTAGLLLEWQMKLGDLDGAFAVADRIVAARDRNGQVATLGLFYVWISASRPFRDDPRFQSFVEALGMPAHWQQFGPPDGYDIRSDRLIPRIK